MSNTHEYVVFDRAKLDRALALKWPAFEKAYPGWGQWESAKEFLVEWALDDESQIESVDEILARKTVRATLAMSDDPFHFLWAILDFEGFVGVHCRRREGGLRLRRRHRLVRGRGVRPRRPLFGLPDRCVPSSRQPSRSRGVSPARCCSRRPRAAGSPADASGPARHDARGCRRHRCVSNPAGHRVLAAGLA